MTDLLVQLRNLLGTRYRIERELGGGGMSRVFVAEEVALGRRVVLKVLPPDTAASVDAERFRREVQFVARLQHPHIVPVHTTGDDGGTLWYTMPYVEGDSLRARLNRGPMSIREALTAWRDMVDALSHAHKAGVIHRDIKPDNVLISGRHAVVTDFGIARAVASATNAEVTSTLTSAGFAIGTPAYMAPEQAVGSADVDARTDLYSTALVAYEMFTGVAPFASMTAAQAIAAQVHTMPALPRSIRPELPVEVERLLMQCLAKDITQRPASAEAVLESLEELGHSDLSSSSAAPGRISRFGSRRVGGAVVAAAIVVVAVAATLMRRGEASATEPPDLVVLASFTHAPEDSSIARAVTEALRIDLAQSPRLRVADQQLVRNSLQTMRQAPDVALSDSLARELAQRTGAKAVVTGSLNAVGTSYVLTARLVSTADGSEAAAIRESAVGKSDLLAAMDRLSKALRKKAGESVASLQNSKPLPAVTTTSLEALEHYAAGSAFINDLRPLEAVAELEKAVSMDSTFASAWAGLATALGNMAVRKSDRDRASERAFQLRSKLAPMERLRIEARYHGARGEFVEEQKAYREILHLDPKLGGALNNLGVILMSHGQYAEAESLFKKAVEVQKNTVVPLDNLYQAAVATNDTLLMDSLRKAMPPEPQRRVLTWRFESTDAFSEGDYQRLEKLTDSLLAFKPEPGRAGPLLIAKMQSHLTRGRVRKAQALLDETMRPLLLQVGLSNSATDFDLRLVLARAVFLDDVEGARTRLKKIEAVATTFPQGEQRLMDRALVNARVGNTEESRRLLKVIGPVIARDSAQILQVEGEVALAEKRYNDAITAFRGMIGRQPFCMICGTYQLARAYDAVGTSDSVVALYERMLASRDPNTRASDDQFERALALKRLGELYENRGNSPQALRWYREFVELWRDADPELQPVVKSVRERISRLEARRG